MFKTKQKKITLDILSSAPAYKIFTNEIDFAARTVV